MMSSSLGCKSEARRHWAPNVKLRLWYWFLYCINKIHACDEDHIYAAWFILGKYCTPSRAPNQWICSLKVTCYFRRFPLFKVPWKDLRLHSSSVQPWPSEPVFDQLPCFLSKQRATGGNCVFTGLSTAVGALWSLKAVETHVWYFCLYPDWTFQVHVKGAETLQTKKTKKYAHI